MNKGGELVEWHWLFEIILEGKLAGFQRVSEGFPGVFRGVSWGFPGVSGTVFGVSGFLAIFSI